MTTIPRSQNHLAELLGITKSICSRHAAKGMPTDTLEAAQAWRRLNLDPARRKGNRFDQHYQAPQRKPAPPRLPTLAEQASAMLTAASAMLETHKPIDALVPGLRAALRAVPPPERDDVDLRLDVMRPLLEHVLVLLPEDRDAKCDDGTPAFPDALTDDEAQQMGEFWYQVAAGEVMAP